ncbi:MAG TPA: hypothetical protein VL588_02980 [Bdellovibrionota bacterium]|nr:hypothetical protein [Bdellovibrionota bacterium]
MTAILAALLCLLSQTARADLGGGSTEQVEEYRAPDIRLRWIDPYGKLMPLDWPVVTRWEWVDSIQKLPVKVPVLRSWVQLPKGYEFAQFQSSNMVSVPDATGSPFGSGGEVITLDTQAIVAKGTLLVRDPTHKIKEYGILMQPDFIEPTIMTHDSCLDFWVEIQKKQGKARYLYNAISCDITENNELDIYIFYSPDAKIDGTHFRGNIETGPGWIRYRGPLPRVDKKIVMGYVRVTDLYGSGEKSATVQRVIFNGAEAGKRLRFNFGVSPTLMAYHEAPLDISVNDIALTAKVTATYTLVPERFDFSASAYGTAVTLSHSTTPKGLAAPRFLGINMRMGYQFSGQWLGGKWQALLGWYIWTMTVPDKQYGISLLAGPQVFIVTRTNHRRERNYFAYFKYAPIVDNPKNLSLSNAEVAVGAGYQITRPGGHNPLFGTLDFSSAHFEASPDVNVMDLTTISLGLSWSP